MRRAVPAGPNASKLARDCQERTEMAREDLGETDRKRQQAEEPEVRAVPPRGAAMAGAKRSQ